MEPQQSLFPLSLPQREYRMPSQGKDARPPDDTPNAIAQSMTRRRFLRNAAAAGALTMLPTLSSAAENKEGAQTNKFIAFTKPLQSLSYNELAQAVAAMGYDGIEVGVRDKGHVLPVRVEEDLPKLVESLKNLGREVTIITTGISTLRDPHAEKVLRTASRLGIKYFRLAYYRYDDKRPIPNQLDEIRSGLRDLVAASHELGLTVLYQNHSGADLVGAPIWDIYELFKDIPVAQAGAALDVGHVTVEGGLSWPVQYRLLRPLTRAIYVKDFVWNGDQVQWVPLGKGRVAPKVFSWLRESNFAGPISVHVEYLENEGGDHVAKNIEAFTRDLKTLRGFMSQNS